MILNKIEVLEQKKRKIDCEDSSTTKSASIDFSHSTSVAKIEARGNTAVLEY